MSPAATSPGRLERVERCPGDGAALLPPAYGATVGGVTWGVRRCPVCGRAALDPRPAPEALGAWYRQEYFGAGSGKFVGWIERFIDWFRESRARDAETWVRRMPPRAGGGEGGAGGSGAPGGAAARGSVLDVGCGSGRFLAALARRGFDCHGTEYSGEAARRAAAIPGLSVHAGPIEEDTYAPGGFDLVSVWHVLEHLYDPDTTLRRVARWLRDGGVLLLAVPNIDSWQARLFRGAWFHLDPPRHLFHFGPGSLRRALEAAGFRVVRVRHLSWEQNLYGVLQSGLNALGFPREDVYEALKGNRRLGGAARDYAQAALLAAGLLPAALFTLAEAAAGRGGTLELVARKESGSAPSAAAVPDAPRGEA